MEAVWSESFSIREFKTGLRSDALAIAIMMKSAKKSSSRVLGTY
jgi:hypothetical protein